MRKILVVVALALASPAFAEQAMLPSHAVASLAQAMADNFGKTIDALAWSVTTVTQGSNRLTATVTTTLTTESAPTATNTTSGIDISGIEYVRVRLVTSAAATAGGKLEAPTSRTPSTTTGTATRPGT